MSKNIVVKILFLFIVNISFSETYYDEFFNANSSKIDKGSLIQAKEKYRNSQNKITVKNEHSDIKTDFFSQSELEKKYNPSLDKMRKLSNQSPVSRLDKNMDTDVKNQLKPSVQNRKIDFNYKSSTIKREMFKIDTTNLNRDKSLVGIKNIFNNSFLNSFLSKDNSEYTDPYQENYKNNKQLYKEKNNYKQMENEIAGGINNNPYGKKLNKDKK